MAPGLKSFMNSLFIIVGDPLSKFIDSKAENEDLEVTKLSLDDRLPISVALECYTSIERDF